MVDSERNTVAPGVYKTSRDGVSILEGTVSAMLRSGLVQRDWFDFESERPNRKHSKVGGREVRASLLGDEEDDLALVWFAGDQIPIGKPKCRPKRDKAFQAFLTLATSRPKKYGRRLTCAEVHWMPVGKL